MEGHGGSESVIMEDDAREEGVMSWEGTGVCQADLVPRLVLLHTRTVVCYVYAGKSCSQQKLSFLLSG